MEKLSFVIPCYRSENTIENILGRVVETVKKDGRYDYEIVCVNDCSPDNVMDKLREKSIQNDKIKVISLSRNFGQHSALMAGFNYVSGDIIVCLDDDGQNPPEEMFKLIDKLEEGYDLVSAKYVNEKRNIIRKLGTKLSFAMSSYFINKPSNIDLNSYYVFRRYIVDEIIKYKNAYPFVHGLILRVTRNMANVIIPHEKRVEGKSGYSLNKLFGLWLNGFTAFSEKPLRVASIMGWVVACIGIIFGIVVVVRKIVNPDILIGYSSIMAVILFLGGMIMLFIGLLGEYVGRIYISLNNAPQYAIKEVININK